MPCPRQARQWRRAATPSSPYRQGSCAGFQLLHSDVSAEKKRVTVVYGWSVANAKAAKHTATNDPTIEEKPSGTESGEKKSSGSTTSGKEIHSEKATSDDAGEFVK